MSRIPFCSVLAKGAGAPWQILAGDPPPDTSSTSGPVGESVRWFEPVPCDPLGGDHEPRLGALWGRAPSMCDTFQQIRDLAPTDVSVLVAGETGTGKELVARALHDHSPRRKGPFVAVDCASIPPALAESELFGHERGSFTHAVARTSGAFREASGGTLFLDELGELPPEVQPKLLRALAEQKVKRVGATVYEAVDVRVVAATHRDLGRANPGCFRSDLFFRIAQVRLGLPPLRERREDIPLLVWAACEHAGKPERAAELTEVVCRVFAGYEWPGNVRELFSFVRAAAQLQPGSRAMAALLRRSACPVRPPVSGAFSRSRQAAIEAFERDYFERLAAACDRNVSAMARASGLERHHVRRYLKKYGLGSFASPVQSLHPLRDVDVC